MSLLELLAQQAGPDVGLEGDWWNAPTTRFLGRYWKAPPYIAIPIFLGVLAATSFLFERLSVYLIGHFTSRTPTKVDDAFVEGFPRLVRTICILIAINVVTHALLGQDSHETAGRVIVALSIVVLGFALTQLVLRLVDAWTTSRPQIGPLGPGIRLAVKVAVIPVLLITVLRVFDVPVEAFLTALGVGSLAVALALQDILKNVFAGIQLVMDQPVRAGDYVILASGVRGTVLDVGLRSTRLRTLDNNIVILPNNTLANEIVTNTDVIDNTYIHHATIGVGYGSDTRKVEAALLDEAGKVIAEVPGFLSDTPKVAFTGFGQSTFDFRVTVRLSRFSGQFEPLSELNHRLLARLRAEDVEIPFPTRTVVLRNDAPAAGS